MLEYILSGLFACVPYSVKTPDLTNLTLNEALEYKLSHHPGPFVELVEQDYSDSIEDGIIHIRQESDNFSSFDTLGFNNINSGVKRKAYYRLDSNELVIENNSEGFSYSLEAFDHELWHGIHDNLEQIDGYTGPSNEGIESFCSEILNNESFRPIVETNELESRLVGISVRYNQLRTLAENSFDMLNTLASLGPKVPVSIKDRISEEDIWIYSKDYLEVSDKLNNFGKEVLPLVEEIKYLIGKEISLEKTISKNLGLSFIESHLDSIEKDLYLIESYIPLFERVNVVYTEIIHSYYLGMNKAAKDKVDFKSEELEVVDQIMSEELSLSLLSNTPEEFDYDNIMRKLSVEEHKKAILDRVYDCRELTARGYEHLIGLNMGAGHVDNFRLDEEWLNFFGSFTIRGEPILKKQIKKYYKASLLVDNNGLSEDYIRESLLDKGHRNEVKIVGKIPHPNLQQVTITLE